MVKSIQINFDDVDFERLVKAKGNLSWRDFMLKLVVDTDKQEKPYQEPRNAYSGIHIGEQ